MKCQKCSFINSNNSTHCINCNEVLPTENRIISLEEKNYLKRPRKSDSEEELKRVKSKLEKIRGKTTEQPIVKDVSISTAKIATTTIATQEPPPKIATPITVKATNNLETKILEVEAKLDQLMINYRKVYKLNSNTVKKNISLLYDKVIESLPSEEIELEINPIASSSSIKSRVIEDLYTLQLNEIDLQQNRKTVNSDFQPSHSRELSGESLHRTFNSLERDLLKEAIKREDKKTIEESEMLPVPGSAIIIAAFLLDVLISLLVYFSLVIGVLYKFSNHQSFSIFFKQLFIHDFKTLLVWQSLFGFISTYFVLNLSLTFIKHASLGQHVLGLKISDLNNKEALSSALLKRFFLDFVNLLSLGIRPLILLKKNQGMSCLISNTKISYTAFVE